MKAQTSNVEAVVPFLRVADIGQSVRFYVDGLGFGMEKSWVVGGELRWCWLQLGAAAVMLQQFANRGRDSWVPAGRVGEGVTLCFQCADALGFYRAAIANDVAASEPEVGNGMWCTTIIDPDGYVLMFESPTAVAEDTKLSELAPGARRP